jgi:transposase-like protein
VKVHKLRRLPFETALIERYGQRGNAMEEVLVQMYLAALAARPVEGITEA